MHESKMFALGEVKAVEDADGDPNGEFDVILSAPTLDRDGEVIDAKVFEPLPDHITFDIDHGMSTATTVGSGVPEYTEDGKLRVKGTYSSIPRAQEVRTLVREGHIRTTSVAFMGAVREEKDGVQHVVKAELLNGAFVPIPSNRESVVLSAKSYAEATRADDDLVRAQRDVELAGRIVDQLKALNLTGTLQAKGDKLVSVIRATKAGSRNSTKDAERLQHIHDLAVDNGAICATTESATSAPETPAKDAGKPDQAPADEAGKSPASNVVEMARIRADIARLSLTD